MTHLEAANQSFANARTEMQTENYAQAARLFHHAKEMFQKYEYETGDKRRLSDHAARWTRTAIQKRDFA